MFPGVLEEVFSKLFILCCISYPCLIGGDKMTDTLFKEGTDVAALAEKLVVQYLPDEEKPRFAKVLSDWEGREADVIGVMNYAA